MAKVVVDPKVVRAFRSEAAFEAWLSKNHAGATELWLKIHKKGSGLPTVTPAQAIDVALCWGWIDGLRKSLDETSYLQRFTPRRKKSIWSQINRDHVARLIAAGRMTPHGMAQVDAAKADGRWDAAYAPIRSATLPDDLRAAVEASPAASATLAKLDRMNVFAMSFRLGQLKTPEKRAARLAEYVAMLARGETLLPLHAARKPVARRVTALTSSGTAPAAPRRPRR
jgi:uncharacterized protein YdeI (YjbR/CyaY-like superfamily)